MLFQRNPLHLVFRRKPVFDHGARTYIPHLGLHKSTQITRRSVNHTEDRMQFLIKLHHHSGAKLCGCNHE